MNQEIYQATSLTGEPQNTYSESRVIYMPDVVVVDHERVSYKSKLDILKRNRFRRGKSEETAAREERERQAKQERLDEIAADKTPHEVIEELAGGEPRTPGFGPKENARFREKVHPKYNQAENASLPDSKRITRAEEILHEEGLLDPDKSLTEDQAKALLKAHNTENAFKKVEELRKEFNESQRRTLIESHLAGMTPPTTPGTPTNYDTEIESIVNGIDPAAYTDPGIVDIVTKMKNLYANDYLDGSTVEDYFGKIHKIIVEKTAAGTPAPDLLDLEVKIGRVKILNDFRTGRSTGRDYSTLINKDNDYKVRIADAATPEEKADLEIQRMEFVRDIAKNEINVQSGNPAYDQLFEIIIDEGNSLDYIVNRIIAAPMDSESGDWSLGFYGQNNLDSIINLLRTKSESDSNADIRAKRKVQYQSVGEIEQAAQLAHEVNKAIVNADLRAFSNIAGSMDAEKLSRLAKVKGAGIVGRLLEVEYGNMLARDKWINSSNYSELMGRSKDPETGLVLENQSGSALTSFKQLVESAKARVRAETTPGSDTSITAEMRELATLEDWQVSWAFNIGKSLYNMWLRSGEWISQGKTPKGDKGYVSFPQESIARILNYPQWMLERFEISESRGGMEWLERAVAKHQAIRQEEGYGKMELKKIGGKDIANFEMPDMVGVRGWWATWREKQLLMTTMPLRFEPRGAAEGSKIYREGKEVKPGDITDLGVLLDSESALEIALPGDGYKGSLSKAPIEIRKDFLRSVFLDANGEIRGDYKRGLGASLFFLKPSPPHGHHKHEIHEAHEMNELKEYIREKLWSKTAEENPLALVPYLEGMEYTNGSKVSFVPGPNASQAEKAAWRTFERKLFQLNEIKMQKIKDYDSVLQSDDPAVRDAAIAAIRGITLSGILNEERVRPAGGIVLDGRENAWLNTLRHQGEQAAGHLANVRFEYNPFLNDAPLEKVDYNIVGAEGYRRMLNDTSGFQEANEALIKIMDSPSKFKAPEEFFEAILPFIEGTGGILGTGTGQRKGYLWLEAALDFYERGNNTPVRKFGTEHEFKTIQRVERWFRQQAPINGIREAFHKPTSIAQEYGGPEATEFDSQQIFHASHEAMAMGIITHEEEKRWHRRFGGALKFGLTRFLRGLFAGTVILGADIGKRSFNDLETG